MRWSHNEPNQTKAYQAPTYVEDEHGGVHDELQPDRDAPALAPRDGLDLDVRAVLHAQVGEDGGHHRLLLLERAPRGQAEVRGEEHRLVHGEGAQEDVFLRDDGAELPVVRVCMCGGLQS